MLFRVSFIEPESFLSEVSHLVYIARVGNEGPSSPFRELKSSPIPFVLNQEAQTKLLGSVESAPK